ncbi:GPR1/FUN34/YaaH family transporter [Alicyclobacillus fructus]|uniref:GPR1/FUN34/YaaH family transporter n=1 Tax=Alicyclobacillus fructus TaxID=2816082 RepID=UPI001F3A5B42|nr:GPR1/FUN34/YaaH family transporter [Alicyclobacillus fructus]
MQDKRLGDPIVMGLAAFVIAQTLLNLPNAHLVPAQVTLFFMPAILVCGGLVYFLACIFSYVRGDTFGLSVNGFYGAFFTSLFLFFYRENGKKGTRTFPTVKMAKKEPGPSLRQSWNIVDILFRRLPLRR